MKKENRANMVIGLVSGIFSGLIILVSQEVAKSFGKEGNIWLIMFISIIVLMIFISRILRKKKK